MPLVDCLKKILETGAWEEGHLSDGHQVIKLKDKHSGMRLKIRIMAGNPILAMPTENNGRNALKHLSCLKGECRSICDYLIIFQSNANYYAVFIEMKKTVTNQKGHEQLRRSLPILDYLVSACKTACKIKPRVSVKYALIAEKSSDRLDKQRTRTTPSRGVDETYEAITIKKFIGNTDFFINTLAGL